MKFLAGSLSIPVHEFFCIAFFVVAKGVKNIIPSHRYTLLQDAQAIGQVLFLLTKKIKVE
ncbi:hypothetical protein FC682_07575 [Peribacillus simplex]|uniref:hypothetical protein n=1 Tax=Peribacillus simplex TaxID=1478 RepID=UPI0010BE5325|nr:hypothetical protein [Peribacillus simplex]TKH05771.1 hypothetical protein FC682_07575 [Peribacillus simplex]